MRSSFVVSWLVALALTARTSGQERFDLVIPGSELVSTAERTEQRLRIEDAQGNVTVYQREPRHDSADQAYLGYESVAARQIIRWPADGRGRLRIAASSAPLAFRPSQMEIRWLEPVPVAVAVDELDPRTAYRLVPVIPDYQGLTLTSDRDGIIALRRISENDSQAWHFLPLGSGLFRIHSDLLGRRWSLANERGDAPQLTPTSNALDQLWQVMAVPGEPGQLVLASIAAAGPKVLGCDAAGRIAMRPRNWGTGQLWRLIPVRPAIPPVFDEYRFVSREIQPDAALPPAQVDLVNSHIKEIWVLVADRLQPGGGMRVKIPAGGTVQLSFERDAGGMLVEVYERGLRNGAVQRDEFATQLPPAVRYDLSVYELIVQSVAIDRTVPGGKLEDVRHAPRSIGWFELPPGPLLEDGTLDAYAVATAQQNPGQVRRIDPGEWQPRAEAADPVEKLLRKFQPQSK